MNHFPGPYTRIGARVVAVTHGATFTLGRADSPKMTKEGNEETAKLWAASPELVDALIELVDRCDGPEGVGADGSNIQTIKAHAILAKLGYHY